MSRPRTQAGDHRLVVTSMTGLGIGGAAVLAAVWAVASPSVRTDLVGPLSLMAVGVAVIVVVGGAGVSRWVASHLAGSRRLSDEIDLIASVDPSHRASETGPDEIATVARAVNGLAGRFWESICERDAAIARGREQAEQDRERLVALMAELTVGVIVCNADGRILLYNSRAVQIFADERATSPVGLGRSLFAVLDRGALTNAIHRLELDSTQVNPVRLTAVGPAGQLLRTSVGPVRSDGATGLAGFVVVVDEATDEHLGRQERDEMVRAVLEEARGRLAGIGGAVQMLESYDDLAPTEISRFHGIIREESDRLTGYLAGVQERHRRLAGIGWELSEMLGRDLLWALQRRLEQIGVATVVAAPGDDVWVGVDAGGVIEALASTVGHCLPPGLSRALSLGLSARAEDGFVAVELRWLPAGGAGSASADDWTRCRAEVVAAIGAAVAVEGDVGRLARRHGGEAWAGSGAEPTLTLLLPRVEAVAAIASPVPSEDRPTTYDFSLLARQPLDSEQAGRCLDQLSYTVFDLETTGVEPTKGDEILSIGAVRLVNGQLLRHETFDRLVDPGRPIPPSSIAIHGITDEVVAGQPTIAQALPQFARFVESTILVGHNVAFDMRFLELARPSTGVAFEATVLDTLLLAELAFGESNVHSLEWIADTLGVDVIGRHTALGDSLVTAEVFLRLIPLLETKKLRTLAEVTEAAATTRYARLKY